MLGMFFLLQYNHKIQKRTGKFFLLLAVHWWQYKVAIALAPKEKIQFHLTMVMYFIHLFQGFQHLFKISRSFLCHWYRWLLFCASFIPLNWVSFCYCFCFYESLLMKKILIIIAGTLMVLILILARQLFQKLMSCPFF